MTKSELKEYLASHRRVSLDKGFMFKDHPVKTDGNTMLYLMGAFTEATANPAHTMKWKFDDGHFAVLNAQDIIDIYTQGRAFVQGLFDKEGLISFEIDAGNLTSTDAVFAAWNN